MVGATLNLDPNTGEFPLPLIMQALFYVERGGAEAGIRLGVSNFVVAIAVMPGSIYFAYRAWIGAFRFGIGFSRCRMRKRPSGAMGATC